MKRNRAQLSDTSMQCLMSDTSMQWQCDSVFGNADLLGLIVGQMCTRCRLCAMAVCRAWRNAVVRALGGRDAIAGILWSHRRRRAFMLELLPGPVTRLLGVTVPADTGRAMELVKHEASKDKIMGLMIRGGPNFDELRVSQVNILCDECRDPVDIMNRIGDIGGRARKGDFAILAHGVRGGEAGQSAGAETHCAHFTGGMWSCEMDPMFIPDANLIFTRDGEYVHLASDLMHTAVPECRSVMLGDGEYRAWSVQYLGIKLQLLVEKRISAIFEKVPPEQFKPRVHGVLLDGPSRRLGDCIVYKD